MVCRYRYQPYPNFSLELHFQGSGIFDVMAVTFRVSMDEIYLQIQLFTELAARPLNTLSNVTPRVPQFIFHASHSHSLCYITRFSKTVNISSNRHFPLYFSAARPSVRDKRTAAAPWNAPTSERRPSDLCVASRAAVPPNQQHDI